REAAWDPSAREAPGVSALRHSWGLPPEPKIIAMITASYTEDPMPRSFPRFVAAAAAAAALLLAAPLADAKTLRWSSQGDYLTADPMAQNELLTNSMNGNVYENLVKRGKNLEIVPALAVSWKQVNPNLWVFNLRKGVKWQDG